MKKGKLKRFCGTVGMISLLLCGCEKADMVSELDFDADILDNTEQGTSPLELQEVEKWVDEFIVSEGAENMSVSISSEVIIPEAEQMSVVEVQVEPMDQEFVTRWIEKLYGDQEVMGGVTEIPTFEMYTGIYNSLTYELSFDKGEEKTISFDIEDMYEVCPEEMQKLDDVSYVLGTRDKASGGKNTCTFSEEEAKTQAETFLRDLGWSEVVWENIVELEWLGFEQQEPISTYDGYLLEGYIGVDGMIFETFASTYQAMDGKDTVFKGKIELCINDHGILNLNIQEPVNIVEITKNVALLPIDTVKAIIRREINEHPEIYLSSSETTWFTELELNYIRVKDKNREDYYTYVPVWRLSYPVGTERKISNCPLIVNAMDGSIIYLEDTM